MEHLKRRAAEGVKVPAVAFGLGEMLRCRMQVAAGVVPVPHYSESIARE